MDEAIQIVGGGLAVSEAARQLAEPGMKVRLREMRGGASRTAAHGPRSVQTFQQHSE